MLSTVSVPIDVPGAMRPEFATEPMIVPVPPNVPAFETVVSLASIASASSRPALIVVVPGTEQVKASEQVVEYVDIYPTLCELAGLELPVHLQGNSFRELLFDEEATSDGVAICQWFAGVTTIRENWFYTEWISDSDSAYARMLYDHQVDPGENVNISVREEYNTVISDLSAEMRRSRAPNYFK
jgi:iduronate 2-sulfatase